MCVPMEPIPNLAFALLHSVDSKLHQKKKKTGFLIPIQPALGQTFTPLAVKKSRWAHFSSSPPPPKQNRSIPHFLSNKSAHI